MNGSYLGPEFNNEEIEKLNDLGAKFEFLNDDKLIEKTVSDLS